jgi:hypothetical protein
MHETIALFLLKHPPLDEIGGTITDVIEKYRYSSLTKDQALDQMLTLHEPFLVKYAKQQIEINNLLCLEQSI